MKKRSLRVLLRRLWYHLGRRRRRHFVLLFALMLVSAFAEVLSLSAVLPFIGVLAAPDRVFAQPFVSSLATTLGIDSPEELVLPLTIAFAIAALFAGGVRILLTWLSTRLTFITGADISIEVYRRTLYQPYSVHVSRSSSELISGITGKVGHTTLGVLLPLLTLVSASVLILAIVATLIVIDPVVALVAAAGFGCTYGLITGLSRRRLNRNSQRIADQYTQVVKALQEGLGGIRDVLLNGTQPVYCEVYRKADQQWRLAQGENVFIGQSPRFAMEAFGMILIAALAYGMSLQPGGLTAALPVIGALALGAQRLLPSMQQGYAAWASISGSYASFADTIDLLDQPVQKELLEPLPAPLALNEKIELKDIRFRYAESEDWVLDGLSLDIARGSRVGFVGSTGSGKSTLMDIVMGLLKPTSGQIAVDGQPLSDSNIRAWQQSIAHVPQSIFLADASFAANIALGEPVERIDIDKVRSSASQARVAEFIESNAEAYDAFVGEQGVRLSGGQRQRIGIARALYRQADVLVLDEATSALDNETEQSVMSAIANLDRGYTVLLVAHRLTTVKNCDFIVELERGRVAATGTYEQLLDESHSFRRMVKAAEAG